MSFYSSADIKNELLEPSVHNPSDRSEFRIVGDVLPSLKLVNNASIGQAGTTLQDLVGALGNIKNVFIYDGRTELTAIRDFNKVMGFKNLMFDNHHNSDIDRFLKRHNIGYQNDYFDNTVFYARKTNVKNSVTNTLPATDTVDNRVRCYFDLREAFNMLQKVPVLSDKAFPLLRVVLEYERDMRLCTVATNVTSTNARPLLAIDRIVNPVLATNLVNSLSTVSYTDIEHDRVSVDATTAGVTNKVSRKLLGFNNKIVNKLRVKKEFLNKGNYVNANAIVGFGLYESLCCNAEVFQLNINGRPLFPRAGIEGENRRLAMLVDTHGEINLYDTAHVDLITNFDALTLDGTGVKNGKLDFFATEILERVNELQLDYTRTGVTDATNPSRFNASLELIVTAEVRKVLQVGNGSYTISYE